MDSPEELSSDGDAWTMLAGLGKTGAVNGRPFAASTLYRDRDEHLATVRSTLEPEDEDAIVIVRL
jgi:hypothetical protein